MIKTLFKNPRALTLRQRADRVLGQMLLLSALTLGALAVLTTKFSRDLYATGQFVFGKIESACGCLAVGGFSNHPWHFSALFLLGLALALTFLVATYKIVRLCLKTRRFVRQNVQPQNPTGKLLKAARELNLTEKIVESATAEPVVFCFGYLRPRVCVSSALAERLSPGELTAVLAHEKFHLKAREPAKLLIVRIISSILFFLPGVKTLAKQYLTFSELAADEAATAGFTNKIPLARALHKIIGWEQKRVLGRVFALSFFSALTAERVRRLADDGYTPSAAWFNPRTLAGIMAAVALFFGANYLLSSPALGHSFTAHTHHGKTCSLAAVPAQNMASAKVCASPKSAGDCAISYALPASNRC